jgi:hypothetical protein
MQLFGYVGVHGLLLRDDRDGLAAATRGGIRPLGGEYIRFKEGDGVT